MGNWRNRPRLRNFYQEKPQRSPPRYHYPEPPNPGFSQDGVPLWEKKFCALIGSIPWQKVVDAKKFMYCHSNVLNWDDCASEEAFQNAKKRFWAEINGLHCDISVPDPDIYVDEVDWSPHIDPELIKDLDREYFAPDEDKGGKVGGKNKKTKNSASICPGPNITANNGGNPWEYNNMHDSGALKDKTQDWNQWDNHINDSRKVDNDDNPWECSYSQENGAAKDSAWGDCGDKSWGWNQEGNHTQGVSVVKHNGWRDCGNRSWGWKQGVNHINQSRNWENGDSSRDGGGQGVSSMKDKAWGVIGDNSVGWKHWESRNLDNGDNPWEHSFIQDSKAPKDRGWRDCGSNLWGCKQWDNNTNEPKNFETKRSSGGWGTWNEGARKREGSFQHLSGYKSSRFEGDAYQTGHCWSKGRTKKRVSFALG